MPLDLSYGDLIYRLDTLGMKRAWEKDREDNVDATHPIRLRTYIDPTTKLIQKALLRLQLMPFRSYSDSTADFTIGTLYTRTTGVWWAGTLDSASILTVDGGHNHGGVTGAGGTDLHTHSIGSVGGHSHFLNHHYHDIAIPAHKHVQVHAIYESTTAAGVTVVINGTDRTAALGGPFNADAAQLDITQYLAANGWNTVQIGSTALGRVAATMYIETYLP